MLTDWALRLRSIFKRGAVERELDDELRFHLERQVERYVRQGLGFDEAVRKARMELGGLDSIKEQHRDARGTRLLENVAQDVRYALRLMRRSPGFAGVAVLTLGLGIGANTAMFSFVNAVLLRPLPYRAADRLVRVVTDAAASEGSTVASRGLMGLPVAQLRALRISSRTLADIGVYVNGTRTLTGFGSPLRVDVTQLSPAALRILQARPAIGRLFRDTEESAGSVSVTVLSHGLWQRHFGGRADILDRPIVLDGRTFFVVGVMPEGFQFPDSRTQLWIPYVLDANALRATVTPLARLANGVSPAAATTELRTVMPQLLAGGPAARRWRSAEIVRWQEQLVGPIRPALLILTVAVGFVLLVACANISSILLARASARDEELALRSAIGAGRGRLLQQLITEIAVLALAGGIAGTTVAFVAVRLVRNLGETLPRSDMAVEIGIPRLQELTIDSTVLLFTFSVALIAGMLAGLLPAIRQLHVQPVGVLRAGAATPDSGLNLFSPHRVQALLVIGQVALATILLVGGGLLLRSFLNLADVDPGYDSDRVLTFNVFTANRNRPPAFDQTMASRLESVPGVQAAGYSELMPMVRFRIGGVPLRRPSDATAVPGAPTPDMYVLSPGFLKAMRVRVVEGRALAEHDGPDQPRVLLINRTLARSGFLGRSPVGTLIFPTIRDTPWEIVGVVDDLRQQGLDQEPSPQIFMSARQFPIGNPNPYFAVRAARDPATLIGAVRDAVREVDSQAFVDNIATMETVVANSLVRQRLFAVLLGAFAMVATTLAAIGIYGVMAHSVSRRTREIGIRMALGADQESVLRLVLGQSLALTLIGLGGGVAGAMALSRYLERLLFGLSSLDVSTFAGVSLVFLLVGTLASWVPAYRAASVAPMAALRSK